MVEAISNNNVVGVVVVVYALKKKLFTSTCISQKQQKQYNGRRHCRSSCRYFLLPHKYVCFLLLFKDNYANIYLCYINAPFVPAKNITTQFCYIIKIYIHRFMIEKSIVYQVYIRTISNVLHYEKKILNDLIIIFISFSLQEILQKCLG